MYSSISGPSWPKATLYPRVLIIGKRMSKKDRARRFRLGLAQPGPLEFTLIDAGSCSRGEILRLGSCDGEINEGRAGSGRAGRRPRGRRKCLRPAKPRAPRRQKSGRDHRGEPFGSSWRPCLRRPARRLYRRGTKTSTSGKSGRSTRAPNTPLSKAEPDDPPAAGRLSFPRKRESQRPPIKPRDWIARIRGHDSDLRRDGLNSGPSRPALRPGL